MTVGIEPPPHPLILNLLKDGRQDFQIPRDFPYRPAAILQQVQDERNKTPPGKGNRRRAGIPIPSRQNRRHPPASAAGH